MATGFRDSVQLLTAATAANGVPTLATHGQPLNDIRYADSGVLTVASTAGSVVMTVTIRLWGYEADSAEWFPLGVGPDATKGIINGGVALGETSADQIAHSEIVSNIQSIDRIYAEITAIGGTATAISCWLVART